MKQSQPRIQAALPFGWRITRYDPAKRDARGAYVGDAWTSISDVGKISNGATLTVEEYERVEAVHIETFAAFALESDITRSGDPDS